MSNTSSHEPSEAPDAIQPPSRLARFAGWTLLIAALAAAAVGLAREVGRAGTPTSGNDDVAVATTTAAADQQVVTVYDFHATQRCVTCLAIEKETVRVLEQHFGDALADGRLRFRSVDFDLPENLHFRSDYDLAFGSIVVRGAGADAAWQNLADVWTLIHGDPALFATYIVEHVRPLLDATG